MKKELIKLANHLDRIGLVKEADYIDNLLKKESWMCIPIMLGAAKLIGCQKGPQSDHLCWWIEDLDGEKSLASNLSFNEGNICMTAQNSGYVEFIFSIEDLIPGKSFIRNNISGTHYSLEDCQADLNSAANAYEETGQDVSIMFDLATEEQVAKGTYSIYLKFELDGDKVIKLENGNIPEGSTPAGC